MTNKTPAHPSRLTVSPPVFLSAAWVLLLAGGLSTLQTASLVGALLHRPTRATAERHLETSVAPALEAVAEELRRRGGTAAVTVEAGAASLQAGLPGGVPFSCAVRLRVMKEPAFVLAGAQPSEARCHQWWLAEVAGAGYDVFGWTREDVIADVSASLDRLLAAPGR